MISDTSYVVKKKKGHDSTYLVQKYVAEVRKETYEVAEGACDCPGYRMKKRRGSVCKHVQMVLKFDPTTMSKLPTSVAGVRDEIAQGVYEKVAKGLQPFAETVTLRELRRNPNTDGVIGIDVHITPHPSDGNVVTKMTGFVNGVNVTLIVE